MSDTSTFEELFATKDSRIIQKCQSLCVQFGITAQDLSDRWEAWSINKKQNLSIESLEKFYLEESKKLGRLVSVKSESSVVSSPSKPSLLNPHRFGQDSADIDDLALDTKPAKKRAREEGLEAPKQNSRFSKRLEKGRLELSHQGNLGQKFTHPSLQTPELKLHPNWETDAFVGRGFPWAYNSVIELSDHILNRVDQIGEIIISKNALEFPSNTVAARQSQFTSLGYIGSGSSNDALQSNQPNQTQSNQTQPTKYLFENDVVLRCENLPPIKLDLLEVEDLTLFNGQIVAVRGVNPHGKRLVAHSLYSIAPPAPRPHSDMNFAIRNRELHLMIASGPYTSHEDLSYEPLNALLSQVSIKQPRVLVLMGPFVDDQHPFVKDGTANKPFADIFADIMGKVETFVSTLSYSIKVVVIPSLNDVTHQNVLPQPAFFKDIPSDFLRAPNPSILRINDMDIGFISTDVLTHLEQNSILKGPNSNDKHVSLVSFLLHQQSFMPIWPTPVDLQLDVEQASKGLVIPELPDAIFFASSQRPFVKIVNGVVAVNVGTLMHGTEPGTYADVRIVQAPGTSSTSLAQRTYVDVYKI